MKYGLSGKTLIANVAQIKQHKAKKNFVLWLKRNAHLNSRLAKSIPQTAPAVNHKNPRSLPN
jgi:hypothetical protein